MSVGEPGPRVYRELHVTSEPAQMAGVRSMIIEAAGAAGFSELDTSQIALAVDEAVCNVIKHGYEGRVGQPIDIRVEIVARDANRGLQVTVCDCGRQVDPARIVGRHLEHVRPGGLGTHIIRSIMDEVEYSQRRPSGMQLRMTKWLGGGKHQQSLARRTKGEANA